jgi:hypothetical protein
MPRRRRIEKAIPHAEISDAAWAYLNDEPIPDGDGETKFDIFMLDNPDGERLRELWARARASVLDTWTRTRPGTRPSTWWKCEAPRQAKGNFPGCYYDGKLPEQRKFISGSGCPSWMVMADVPAYELGLPASWAAFEEDNLPVFESTASYLQRHNLLTAGELRVLSATDYEQTEGLDPSCGVDLGPFSGPSVEGVAWLNQWGARIRERIPAARRTMGFHDCRAGPAVLNA